MFGYINVGRLNFKQKRTLYFAQTAHVSHKFLYKQGPRTSFVPRKEDVLSFFLGMALFLSVFYEIYVSNC